MKISKETEAEFLHSTVVNNYRYYYYLANELLYFAQKDQYSINQFRYSMSVVIFSYSAIENYVLYSIYVPQGKIAKFFENMSDSLKEKLDRLPLMERIELIFKFLENKTLDIGEEPLQSFELLRQLRNFLTHYKPFKESVYRNAEGIIVEETKLEKRIKGKFEFRDDETAFLYKCINVHCAKWAFEIIDKFYDWYSDSVNIPRHKLQQHWPIK